jgi:hypothetical protein
MDGFLCDGDMSKFGGIGSVEPRICSIFDDNATLFSKAISLPTCITQSISPHLVGKKSVGSCPNPLPTAKCSPSISIRFRGHPLIPKEKGIYCLLFLISAVSLFSHLPLFPDKFTKQKLHSIPL